MNKGDVIPNLSCYRNTDKPVTQDMLVKLWQLIYEHNESPNVNSQNILSAKRLVSFGKV